MVLAARGLVVVRGRSVLNSLLLNAFERGWIILLDFSLLIYLILRYVGENV